GKENIAAIAQIQLRRLYQRLEERGYHVTITGAALEKLGEVGFDPIYGARPLKSAIQQEVENPLAQDILSGKLVPGKEIILDLDDNQIIAKQS
ncbi:type VI secretion system ATPase TssH, partial [Acinetobacter baumannii]|nr:type VI secretion system ATPase TssH [Acinetobacter baumannii]